MDVLDNGVHICELANVIHKKAEECVQQGQCNDVREHFIDIVNTCNAKEFLVGLFKIKAFQRVCTAE